MNQQQASVAEYLASLMASERFGPQVVASRHFQPVERKYASAPKALAAPLIDHLKNNGINKLYSHQVDAIKSILNKEDVVVATPTASGKSLIYNLPVFDTIINSPYAKALYLFPLKALAQDQVRTIDAMAADFPDHFLKKGIAGAAIYDGDTTSYWRKKIRENLPGVLVTNPDMLHLGILPYHDLWANLFSNLKYVVIDEVHTYRGVFGSHMAWVIKRLKRICALYGSTPTFILSSATVGNPEDLGTAITGSPVRGSMERAMRNPTC